jgi:hypothetical protein
MAKDRHRELRLERARNLTGAEDFEEAAKVYQELEMWKEAGEVRRKTRHQVVTQVQG